MRPELEQTKTWSGGPKNTGGGRHNNYKNIAMEF